MQDSMLKALTEKSKLVEADRDAEEQIETFARGKPVEVHS